MLDKDRSLTKMRSPEFEGFKIKLPVSEEFKNNNDEFWFEIYNAAKYLYRNDLWAARFRDNTAKEKLLQMLEWNHGLKSKGNLSPKNFGKDMNIWLDENLWSDLDLCFGKLNKQDSLSAMKNLIKLYRKTAIQTAELLGYEYGQKVDENISIIINELDINSSAK